MTPEPAIYPGYRFPAEVIRHAVWLYHLFSLSLRDIELILAERGILVTHESIWRQVLRFGAEFAGRLRKRRPRPGDTWHLDEVLILSANSCGVSQCCEPRHARLGSWYAIKPSHHAGHIDCSR
ncbi:hypothetical protein ACFQX4_28030, partial [Roseomonas sp. GCM10028921]